VPEEVSDMVQAGDRMERDEGIPQATGVSMQEAQEAIAKL
jgi:hypothetical protein